MKTPNKNLKTQKEIPNTGDFHKISKNLEGQKTVKTLIFSEFFNPDLQDFEIFVILDLAQN